MPPCTAQCRRHAAAARSLTQGPPLGRVRARRMTWDTCGLFVWAEHSRRFHQHILPSRAALKAISAVGEHDAAEAGAASIEFWMPGPLTASAVEATTETIQNVEVIGTASIVGLGARSTTETTMTAAIVDGGESTVTFRVIPVCCV